MSDYPLTQSAPPPLDLSRRAQPHELPELMDQPCSRAELRACLRDIAWLNRVLFGYRPILHWLESLLPSLVPNPQSLVPSFRILDIGSGYGDTLRQVERWARGKGIAVELTGLDLNPDAGAIAAEATPPSSCIRWVAADILSWSPLHPPHLVMSSLMAHHLTDAEIVRLLQWMEAHAITGWFLNDLSRHITPYRLLYAFTRLMRLHPFVQNDGPVSIARAFVPADWQRYCAAAGLAPADYQIRAFTPARLCVARTKST